MRFRRPPCVHHTRKACCRVARPGIEPGPTASEADMLSGTLTGHVLFFSTPTWNRTRTKTLGGSCAVHYTTGTKSRRLDSHQHEPLYKSGAFLSRATSAIKSRSARNRTLLGGFGGRLLPRCTLLCFSQSRDLPSTAEIENYPNSQVTFPGEKGDRRELNPYLLLHRQTCLPRTPRTPYCSERKERESNPQGKVKMLNRFPTGSRRQSGCPSV